MIIKNMSKNVVVKVLILIIVASVIFGIFFVKPWGDEINFHYPNSKNMSIENVINGKSSYSSAYTPLPYVFGRIVLEFHDSVKSLRLLNFIVFLTLALYLFKISKHLTSEPILLTFLLIANPYILRSAFMYYMLNYGLMFVVLGIYYYFFYSSTHSKLIAQVFLGLSILCMQWMLITIIALFVLEMTNIKNIVQSKLLMTKIIGTKILVLLPFISLIYFWKGLTHPNFQQHELVPSLQHLNAVFANWGAIFLPLLIIYFKKLLNKKEFLLACFLIPILLLSLPYGISDRGLTTSTGVATQLSIQTEKYLNIDYNITFSILVLAGAAIFMMIFVRDKNEFEFYLSMIIVGLLAAFTSSKELGASHIFLSIPFIILFFNRELFEKKLIKFVVTGGLFLLSMFYTFYYAFFAVNDKFL